MPINEIVPAILAKTKKELENSIKNIEPYTKKVQIDIEDGKFTRTKTINYSSFKGLKTKLKLDLHLMMQNPEKNVDKYLNIKPRPYNITFHFEACDFIPGCIKKIKSKKTRVGIAINPETPIELIKPYLNKVNQILIMTVHPGKQGQKFLPSMLKKIKALRKLKSSLSIQVDGGIKKTNILKIKKAGANSFVVGSAIVKQEDIKKAIKEFKDEVKK